VWRISLADARRAEALWGDLSAGERTRANRLGEELRNRFIIAHGWTRRILGGHLGVPPSDLEFESGESGKPRLHRPDRAAATEFNLSHSGELALLAVTREARVGIDLETRNRRVEYLDLSERFFSPSEREALAALAHDKSLLAAGFFACWCRKEAYLKASGHGISRGLHHFDVSLTPGLPPRLLADRLDPGATTRWAFAEVNVGAGYSAALVAETPLEEVVMHEAPE
jgi:4'-phosphopantetheinyl transferase